MPFSTYDQDNDVYDGRSCAKMYGGAWWYRSCGTCVLNGFYRRRGSPKSKRNGMFWKTFSHREAPLKYSVLKIRPVA